MVSSLSRWLKKAPQPHSVRYTTADDDEERVLEVTGPASRRWKETAEALESLRAHRVECLDKDGKGLRVTVLGDTEMGDSAERESKAAAKEHTALALVLDAQGRRISEAYAAGAEAASRGQDNLVAVVNILTTQWSATMQSLHNVSMNLAKLARQQGQGDDGDEDTVGPALQQLLGIAAMKAMGGMGVDPAANGKPKGKEK